MVRKSITIKKDVWEKLVRLKLEKDFINYSEAIDYLFKNLKKKKV
jgi:predicted CopG family antitoxin